MPCRDTMSYITMTTTESLTWQLGDFRSHNRTVLSSDPVTNVSLTGDICSATTLCDDVMRDYVIMTSSVVYKTTINIKHEMKASKYCLATLPEITAILCTLYLDIFSGFLSNLQQEMLQVYYFICLTS